MSSPAQSGRTASDQPVGRAGGSLAGRAIVAGILGGILIDLFLFISRTAPFPGVYQFIASSAVGQVAFTSQAYIWLGVLMHFVVSIVWALIYAYAANAAHALRKWVGGGIVFGVVVMIVMQIISMITHVAQPLTTTSVIITLISHIIFFGLPVAWYMSLPYRRA